MNKIIIIVASHRKNSESKRVAGYLVKQGPVPSLNLEVIDLKELSLPFWEEGISPENPLWRDSWFRISDKIIDADGFIFVSPEYAGMATPYLKNFFLFCSKKHLAHKPALLVSVSAARGGAYPISELRMSGYKNNLICYLPEHLIIRNVSGILKDEVKKEDQAENEFIGKRISYALKLLSIYAGSFKKLRDENDLLLNEFPNGM